MPRTTDARDKAVAATARLLQRKGYAATGLSEILRESGAPKGSFYFHFPGGKEQLAAAAVQASGHAIRELILTAVETGGSLGNLVRDLAALEADVLARSGFELGCPVATTTLEMASSSDVIRSACVGAFESWIGAIAAAIRTHGVAQRRAEELAEWTVATIEGALLLARARRDADVVTRLGGLIADQLEAQIPPPSSAGRRR